MIERFWNLVDQRHIVRRVAFFVTLWMTWRAFTWAAVFAETSSRTGMDVAAIIAAVTAPIAALQGYVFSQYGQGRKDG